MESQCPEPFQRVEQLLGPDDASKIRDSFVVVIGLGAVGGFALEALARSGVGKIRVVDHDVIRPSNLNRQILAHRDSVGKLKSRVAQQRVLSISPECEFEAKNTFVHRDTLEEILSGNPDVVLDAIDSLNPKIELIAELLRRKQTAISSMGAALRTDPFRVRIGPLSQITHCPLAAFLRKRLRRRGIDPEIPCAYSDEETRLLHRKAVHPPDPNEVHLVEKGRHRTSLGSLATITGIFGLTLAHWVLMKLCDRDIRGKK